MQQFKTRPGSFSEIRNKIWIRTIPLAFIAMAVGLYSSTANIAEGDTDVNVLPIVIPIALVALGIGLFIGIKRQKAIFESYTLTISDSSITRQQLNTADLSIDIDSIAEIIKQKNGSFTIKGMGMTDVIGIYPQIEHYAELEVLLNQLCPVNSNKEKTFLEKYQHFAFVPMLAAMIGVYTANNKIVVGISGTIAVIALTWSFMKIRNTKNLDNKTKKMSWAVLLVIASMIGTTISKLMR